mmetsp:Transcript_96172/g.200900  ORF Transcript_96172/g.200900 Transcript_96172/m.200900 type:complete len:212 (+) Transcript_96172:300-935(+)
MFGLVFVKFLVRAGVFWWDFCTRFLVLPGFRCLSFCVCFCRCCRCCCCCCPLLGPDPCLPNSPIACLAGTRAVVRPPTVRKTMVPPLFGSWISFLRVPASQRRWNNQLFGNRSASASTFTAVCTTEKRLLRRLAIWASESVLAMAAGWIPALCKTSSATQLPTPHTSFDWSNSKAFTGMVLVDRTSEKCFKGGSETRGSGARLEIGGCSSG